MAVQGSSELSYDNLVAMIPFVMDFLDLDSDDIIASGLFNDDRLDDAAIALILSHQKACNGENIGSSAIIAAMQSANHVDHHDEELVNHSLQHEITEIISANQTTHPVIMSENSEQSSETQTNHEILYPDIESSLLNAQEMGSFKSQYRVNQNVCDALLQDLLKLTTFSEKMQGLFSEEVPAVISLADSLMLTLQFLGSRLPMSQLAAAASMSGLYYSSVVHETMNALYELLPHYIHWPDENRVMESSDKFRQRSGLQGVLGTVDVLHVPVKVPEEEHVDYYTNQQKETTMLLQTVCDHRLHFLHCSAGWPGSIDEDSVLKDSDLCNDIQDQVSAYFPLDSYLIGDEAYGLTPWLLTPFPNDGNLSALQQKFNAACHNALQDTALVYSLLMQRFPRLDSMDEVEDMQSRVVTILVCCALHNFCLDNDDKVICEDVPVTVRNINSSLPEEGSLDEEGESKRQRVMQLLKES